MATTKEIGDYGEKMAKGYLLKKGYEILETNFRFRRTEVDIIARLGETIVFVEVKVRSSDAFGRPEDAVDSRKQSLLLAAANQYLLELEHEGPLRMDIIAILLDDDKTEITHFEDAFFPHWGL